MIEKNNKFDNIDKKHTWGNLLNIYVPNWEHNKTYI